MVRIHIRYIWSYLYTAVVFLHEMQYNRKYQTARHILKVVFSEIFLPMVNIYTHNTHNMEYIMSCDILHKKDFYIPFYVALYSIMSHNAWITQRLSYVYRVNCELLYKYEHGGLYKLHVSLCLAAVDWGGDSEIFEQRGYRGVSRE